MFINTNALNKKLIPIFTLFLLQFSLQVNGQLCGGGILTFKIYTLNGSTIENFNYEILPVSKNNLETDFSSEMKKDNIIIDLSNNGILISKIWADNIADVRNETLNSQLNQFLNTNGKGKYSIPQSGKFKSTLRFSTVELRYFPVIIKISNGPKTAYALGNYFGGCNREVSLIWGDSQFSLK